MGLTTLNGTHLYHAFISGARQLINQKALLNKINVFPVPDGDTGSNMAAMMQRIITDSVVDEHLGKTLESISSAAIAGSRGNSGIIFSEYLNGIYETLKDVATADVQHFHKGVLNGIKKAYAAIFNPIEGTILTVFRKAFKIDSHVNDFTLYFSTIKDQALIALEQTPKELEVLRLNKVVDAGAKGLTEFIEGVNFYFENGIETLVIKEKDIDMENHNELHLEDISERYCTEALISNGKVTPQELKDLFKDEGSSLVVSGRIDKMRIHIHTNHPDRVFLKLRNYGEIIEQKVDDMIRQQQATKGNHPRIAVVTDSIADIPTAIADKYHIHLIPMYLMIDDVSYLDKYTVTTETFYQMMDTNERFSSSQPDKLTIERNLTFLMEHYDHVLVITVASRLSGTYNAISQFAKLHEKIIVLDSKQNSGAQGLVVIKAAQLAYEGKSIDEILDIIPKLSRRTKIYVSVRTLKYMVRQGRVSKVTGLIGKIINLKPVIGLGKDGEGIIAAKAFSLNGNVRQILKMIKKAPIESFAMVHALAEKRALKLADKITALTGKKPLFVEMISPIVAMNAGIGAVAVAVTFEKEVD